MSDKDNPKETRHTLPRENLIQSALEGKLNAISGYDAIIWKIRAGYTVILYTSLTFLVGTEGTSGIAAMLGAGLDALRILLLIAGFSVTAFIIDFSYLQKKLRVIVARDALMDFALQADSGDAKELQILLHIAGETFIDSLPDGAQKEFRAKRKWNVIRILLPLYATTPVIAFLIYLISLLGSTG